MTRFYGVIGYAESVETAPGVWTEEIHETNYYGDVIMPSRKFDPGSDVNGNITTYNQISVLADQNLMKHFFKIRYVVWNSVKWTVTGIDLKPPRLVMRLGGMYNDGQPFDITSEIS